MKLHFVAVLSLLCAGMVSPAWSHGPVGPGMPRGDHRLTDVVEGKHPLWVNGGVQPRLSVALNGGYTPAQIRAAYGVNALTATGAGQTIALIEAYGDPNITTDLAAFDAQFGLPAPQITVAYPSGKPTSSDSGWALETALDVEWAHAIAPGANLLVVVARSSSLTDLLAAVDYAVAQGATQVSMSWGGSEFSGETGFDYHFNVAGVSFFAASGDSGAGTSWPPASPYVIAVGGTTLKLGSTGSVTSETAWSGSGGGVSSYETRPGFQNGFQTGTGRAMPDVSYVANPATGVAVYISNYQHSSGWIVVGGTSAGTPQWAGLFALANSVRTSAIQLPNAAVYTAAAAATYSADFRDITSGSNGSYTAGTGFDLVTGLGSPLANKLVSTLSGVTTPVSPAQLTVAQSGSSLANNATLNFGTVNQGATNATQAITLTNTGGSTLTLSLSLNPTTNFSFITTPPTSLNAGASATVQIGLSTTSAGSASAQLVIASNDATQNPFDLNLSGNVVVSSTSIAISSGSTAIRSGGALAFGSTFAGVPVTETITVVNTGTTDVRLTGWQITNSTSGPAQFKLSGRSLPPSRLPVGASVNVPITYTASSIGNAAAQLSVYNTATPSSPYVINLTGSATANPNSPKISGGPLATGATDNFGSVAVNTPVIQTITITNLGGAAMNFYVNLQDLTPPPTTSVHWWWFNMPAFTIYSLPTTHLAPGASTNVQVLFYPSTAATSYSAAFSVGSDNASAGSYNLALTGASN